MKFAEEFKFKVWGFSTSRMVLVLDALVFLYLVAAFGFLTDKSLPDPGHDRIRVHLEIASGLVFFALIFCFLPPFDRPPKWILSAIPSPSPPHRL